MASHIKIRKLWATCLFAFVLACSADDNVEDNIDQRVFSEWKRHEDIVEGTMRGDPPVGIVPLEDFHKSCYFFQEITGIPARIDFPYVGGAVSAEKTPEDLEKWRAWFSHNKHRLYWDKTRGTVALR